MPIASCGYTIRDHLFTEAQMEAAFAKLQKMGFDGIENPVGSGILTADRQISLLRKYNLRVCDVGADATKPDEAMALAESFGVKIIGIGPIPAEMMKSVDGFKAFAEQLNILARPYRDAGYKLQYHSHAQELRNFPELNGTPGLAILIEDTDPDTILFELDMYWLSAAGCDPVQWIHKVHNRVPVVHFKDYAIDPKSTETDLGRVPARFAEIGQGNINWPPIVEACRKAGTQWYCIEQDQTVLNAFDCLKISINYMRGLGIK